MLQPLAVSGPFEAQLANLVTVAWVLLIPVGALVALLLYKIFLLLNATLEFITIARYDVIPMLKEARQTLVHVEDVTARVSATMKQVENVANQTKPFLKQSGQQVQDGLGRIATSGQVLLAGLRRAFTK